MELAAWLWTYDTRFLFGIKHTEKKLQNAWVVAMLVSSTLSLFAFKEVNSHVIDSVGGLKRTLRAVDDTQMSSASAPICHDESLEKQIQIYLILSAINVPLLFIMCFKMYCELKSARQYYNLLET